MNKDFRYTINDLSVFSDFIFDEFYLLYYGYMVLHQLVRGDLFNIDNRVLK